MIKMFNKILVLNTQVKKRLDKKYKYKVTTNTIPLDLGTKQP